MAEIRPLEVGEVDSVATVLGLARLYQGDGFYLVAWSGDEPLGHLHLALGKPPELQDVYVRLEYRRQGVGTALTRHAEAEARDRGFDRIRLAVNIEDSAAQDFYRRCGYADAGVAPRRVRVPIKIRTGIIDVDETLVVWEKRLTCPTP